MAGVIQRVAMVSMHGSPTAQPGAADAGGMTVATLGLAAELAVRGVEVDLLTRSSGPARETELLPGVTLHELEAGPSGPLPGERMPEVSDEFGEAVATFARGLAREPDVVHAHYWLSGIASLPVALELGIPLVQSFHALATMSTSAGIPGAVPEPIARVRSEFYLAGQADALIASSGAEATALIDDVGAPADRTWVIPPGVDLELFTPRSRAASAAALRSLGLETDRPLVVVVGRIEPAKGHELAVRALAELHALRGWAPLLVFAGEEPATHVGWTTTLRALAADLGVAADLRLVGGLHRDSLADLLAAATVTLVPSYVETFSLVALESAAAGTPVIAFRAGGIAEAVEEGVSGFLLGTRDPRYWATELAVMIEDEDRRAALGVSARAHAERFSWGTAAASLLGVYAAVSRGGDTP